MQGCCQPPSRDGAPMFQACTNIFNCLDENSSPHPGPLRLNNLHQTGTKGEKFAHSMVTSALVTTGASFPSLLSHCKISSEPNGSGFAPWSCPSGKSTAKSPLLFHVLHPTKLLSGGAKITLGNDLGWLRASRVSLMLGTLPESRAWATSHKSHLCLGETCSLPRSGIGGGKRRSCSC